MQIRTVIVIAFAGATVIASASTLAQSVPAAGASKPMPGAPTPMTNAPQIRPGAGVSPNTGTVARKNARSGGGDELDELEVERRKAQDSRGPIIGSKPPVKPQSVPNTGRTGWK